MNTNQHYIKQVPWLVISPHLYPVQQKYAKLVASVILISLETVHDDVGITYWGNETKEKGYAHSL